MTFAAVASTVGSVAATVGSAAAAAAPVVGAVSAATSAGLGIYNAVNRPSGGQTIAQGGGGSYAQEPSSPYSKEQMAMQAQLMQQANQPLPGIQQNQNVFGGNASGLGANPLIGTQKYFAEGGDVEEQDMGVDLEDSDYIIPADVVSALGNGSTDAGARVLDAFMQHVQKQAATIQMHGQGIAGAGAPRIG